jgi:hypothetical protein
MKSPNRETNPMSDEPLKHVNRPLTEDERRRHAQIRVAAEKDFPPKPVVKRALSGIPAKIRQAREAQRLTWYALAKLAGLPQSETVRDMEEGKDVKVSDLQAVAAALGLQLELVESVA